MTRDRVSKPVRALICLALGLLLAFWTLFDFTAVVLAHLPQPIVWFSNLPEFMYCYYLMRTEPLPADDIPLFQAGQAAQCFFVGIVLNFPYHAFLIYSVWWLVDTFRDLSKRERATKEG